MRPTASPGESGRGGPRWGGRPSRNGFGKPISRSPSAAVNHVRSGQAQLGLVVEEISRCKCLLNTVSQVSLWPPPPPSTSKIGLSRVRLTAVNGTPIRAFGEQKRKIKIGGKLYTIAFLIAEISRPIIGLDFLQEFGMMIDLQKQQLLDSDGATRFSSASGGILGVNVVHVHDSSFARLLLEYPEIADTSLASRTTQHGVECFINTKGPLIKTSPRQLAPDKLRTAKEYFDMMCSAGICRRSDSPWSSGLHMVPKKDGTSRPCGDYRRLNERTTDDAYPTPHVHDFAAGLSGSTICSKVDLVKGYHQIPVREEDIPKMAISTPFGLFEFTRMPFGLKTAAQTFQRLMDKVTAQLHGVFVYLDDMLVASATPEQHERDLWQLFAALRRHGLVLNVGKCIFGVPELEFLGHRVTAKGISQLPCKVSAVQRFERPWTVKTLQRFLGLINFYRRFLPGIAATMQPLTDALAGAPHQMMWTDAMTSAFQLTKKKLAEATLLVHLVVDAELQVNNDASSKAIAGAIDQVVQGCVQPLGFFSRCTSSAEVRYDLELLAVYSTVVKFRHVLEGRRFRIFTDQKPLTSAFFKARDPVLNRQHQQLAFISEFATDIAYVPWIENVVAEALTRQFDDEEASAQVHAVTHSLSDVDLAELAREQTPLVEEPSSSLSLKQVSFSGVDRLVVCDTSIGRPRVLVPEARRRAIFEAIHSMAHPSGKATLAIVAKS